MDFVYSRKRGKPDAASNGNGGFKKSRQEMDSFTTGIGSKSKPCTKFFSPSGCPFGEGCHFLHYVPGGIGAVAQMTGMGAPQAVPPRNPPRNPMVPPMHDSAPSPGLKSRMCKRYNTPEGCKFGDKCRFAHGGRELGRSTAPSFEDHMIPPPGLAGRMSGRIEPPPPGLAAAASFGASATAKISVDASLAGAIIGKGGVNSKQICRLTDVKLSIREHESDPNLRNIELEGTFDQIKQASAMVRELIVNVGSATTTMKSSVAAAPAPHGPGASNFKTKMCDNFMKGSCTFGDRCHFAHGTGELRKSGV
ncbi:hypothetical protein Sjap_012264 [Stephania japonica]|uniref:C3H1-type domain-containing protein n=1 Tax=Stephania japonica TaxID=461633 RepID=A0AAP0NWL1_9MAGN